MSEHDFRPMRGDTPDVEALERFVIDTARDDQPSPGARARLLESSALKLPIAGAGRSRGSIVRALSGRGVYAVGLALLASGATLGFTRFAHDPPAAPSSNAAATATVADAPSAPKVASEPRAVPSVSEASEPRAFVGEARASTKTAPPRGVASARVLAATPTAERAPPKTTAKPASSGETTSTLEREIAHMSTVRAALARGDASRALELLDAYDTEFPSGAFRIDVAVLRIEALARGGRTTEARALGERFLAKYPESASARRVVQTLRNIATPNQDASLAPPPR